MMDIDTEFTTVISPLINNGKLVIRCTNSDVSVYKEKITLVLEEHYISPRIYREQSKLLAMSIISKTNGFSYKYTSSYLRMILDEIKKGNYIIE